MFKCPSKHRDQQPSQDSSPIEVHESKISLARVYEKEILALSEMKVGEDLHVYDVPIDFESDSYIHTYRCGDQNKETLVLIHGYQGASVLYYQMLKDLSQHYRVFCIDLLGMGLSSRNEFKCESTEETIDYFVESIEKWRQAVGITNFHLGGHSFGGYMSCHYAIRYQAHVKKLFMLSPAGVTYHTNAPSAEEFKDKLPWFKKKLFGYVLKKWDEKTTPGAYLKDHSVLGGLLLNQYFKRQFGNGGKDKELAHKLKLFFTELMKSGDGSDKAVFYILRPPRAMALAPLEKLIDEKLNIPILFVYGDKDWMDKTGARRLENAGTKDIRIRILEGSGHQVTMHNPNMLSVYLLKEIGVEA